MANYHCNACGAIGYTEIDHRNPKRFGGTDDSRNLQRLCKPCHIKKSTAECYMAGGLVDEYHAEWFALAYPEREMRVMPQEEYKELLLYVEEIYPEATP